MTGLALRNPIAVLMLCIGLVVFAGVVTPRMSVDTFPELTPPVLIIGTLAPGLGPKDVEKTISWRLEKYVSATPGVDHVESLSRNSFSVIYVWLKWGTDLNAAQTLVQSQAGFAMAAVPKSLGVLPPFVLQYDPSNAPVVQVVVTRRGLHGSAALRLRVQLHRAAPRGDLRRGQRCARRRADAADQRRRRPCEGAGAAHDRGGRRRGSRQLERALARSGEFISTNFDANVYTDAIPKRVATIGEAPVKVNGNSAVLIKDVAQRRGRRDSADPVGLGQRPGSRLPERPPDSRREHDRDRRGRQEASSSTSRGSRPGMKVQAFFDQSTFVRTTFGGLKSEIVQALVLISIVILLFLQSIRGTLIVSVAIPLSFAITLIVLYASGQTLNAFTLGGLTLAMGRLVDDAVVVLESIHRHQRMGLDPRRTPRSRGPTPSRSRCSRRP